MPRVTPATPGLTNTDFLLMDLRESLQVLAEVVSAIAGHVAGTPVSAPAPLPPPVADALADDALMADVAESLAEEAAGYSGKPLDAIVAEPKPKRGRR